MDRGGDEGLQLGIDGVRLELVFELSKGLDALPAKLVAALPQRVGVEDKGVR